MPVMLPVPICPKAPGPARTAARGKDDRGKGSETEHFLVFVHSSPLY